MRPCRHLQRQPMAVRFQAELQQPLGFSFFLGNQPHHIFIQTTLDDVCVHVGRKTVLVLLLSEFLYIFIGFFLLHCFYNYKITSYESNHISIHNLFRNSLCCRKEYSGK